MTQAIKDEVAKANWAAYERARDSGHDKWVENAAKYRRFYHGGGEQWDEKDRARLESEGKPVLETNMVLSTINAMLGERINQQAEIRFSPSRGGVVELAEGVLTPLARHIQDDNDFTFVEGEVTSDGLILDRGYFDIRMDFELDKRGEVRIESLDPFTVIPDPMAGSYDPRKWREVIITRWMTPEDVEAEYGAEHRKAVEAFASVARTDYDSDCIEYNTRTHTFGEFDELLATHSSGPEVQRVRVIERQHRRMGEVRMFVHNETGDMEPVPDKMSDEEAKARAGALNLSIEKHQRKRVRWTVTIGNHVVSDEWSPYMHFTVVPYFPYYMRGRPFGAVRNLISPQEQLNKADSQELHIINTTANSGWDIEAGQLVNMTEEELEQRGAETGLVVVRKPGSPPLAKIKPNTVPSGITNVAAKAGGAIRSISGVHDAMLGDSGPELSGVALESKLKRGLVQLQVPFHNLNRTRKILGEIMYRLIKDYYTEERVYHVADFNVPGAPMRPVELNKQLADGTVINDITTGEYAVRVEVGPSRENVQEVQFAQAVEMRNAGVMVPDHVVIENSQLLHRTEIAELVRQMQGLGEPSPEQQAQQQAMAEFQGQMMQAELQQNIAKGQLLQAQAMQAAAKAGELEGAKQAQFIELQKDLEVELRRLDQRWAELQANLANKLELANLHAGAKTDLTKYQTVAKQTMEQARLRTEQQKALLQSATQRATSAMTKPKP
jgi:hypothetical protein